MERCGGAMQTKNARPVIAVYFGDPGKFDYPFDKPMYVESYTAFTKFCAERGMDVVIVRGAESYQGNMTFTHGWRFEGSELVDLPGPLTVDLIYNKELAHTLVTNPGDLVINDPVFDKIARDKWLTYQAFPELMPVTYQIDSQNWREVLAKIPSDKMVLKPVAGTEARGIWIGDKATIDETTVDLSEPYIAQPFIDSSAGIPGLCEGLHDLRIIVFGGTPALAFLRLPKSGSLVSNLSQGGQAKVVEFSDVPLAVLDAVKRIDDHYQDYPTRIYTADFFMEHGTDVYLIETNTRPGFPSLSAHGGRYTQTFFESLFRVLGAAVATKHNS